MKVISVSGRKGGTGKTLVSHLISLGIGRLGYHTIMLQTDVRADCPSDFEHGRPYLMGHLKNEDEAADLATIDRIYKTAASLPNSVLVVDGGANRRNYDLAFGMTADIILIPVSPGEDDVKTAMRDYVEITEFLEDKERTPPIYYVLNRWPGEKRKQEVVMNKPWIKRFMKETQGKHFPIPIPDMTSLWDISASEGPYPNVAQTNKRAVEVGKLLTKRLGLELPPAETETHVQFRPYEQVNAA